MQEYETSNRVFLNENNESLVYTDRRVYLHQNHKKCSFCKIFLNLCHSWVKSKSLAFCSWKEKRLPFNMLNVYFAREIPSLVHSKWRAKSGYNYLANIM